jgi:hypothetical protein
LTYEIRIYIEGGGDSSHGKARLRQGFSTFFGAVRDAARNKQVRWAVILAGSRKSCFDDFCNACKDHPDAFNILLVDAESEVCTKPREHLCNRDRWTIEAPDEACHLMVQTMEAWLVADRDTLGKYYGEGFLNSAIPNNTDVEKIDKAMLESALEAATRHTQKGSYREIEHGADLLALIDPKVVRARAQHCELLFRTLESLI